MLAQAVETWLLASRGALFALREQFSSPLNFGLFLSLLVFLSLQYFVDSKMTALIIGEHKVPLFHFLAVCTAVGLVFCCYRDLIEESERERIRSKQFWSFFALYLFSFFGLTKLSRFLFEMFLFSLSSGVYLFLMSFILPVLGFYILYRLFVIFPVLIKTKRLRTGAVFRSSKKLPLSYFLSPLLLDLIVRLPVGLLAVTGLWAGADLSGAISTGFFLSTVVWHCGVAFISVQAYAFLLDIMPKPS